MLTKINKPFLIFSLAWAAYGFWRGIHEKTFNAGFGWENLGDFFSGWFSPLAFAWFVYAVFLQMDELKATNETMRMQKDELEGSKKALKEQSRTLELQVQAINRQNAESTFFNMIKSMQDVIAGMYVKGKVFTPLELANGKRNIANKHGRTVLQKYRNDCIKKLNEAKTFKEASVAMSTFYEDRRTNLSHYFRLIIGIIEFADQFNQREDFINILKDHLSDDELVILFSVTFIDLGLHLEYHIKMFNILQFLSIEKIVAHKYIEEQLSQLKK